MTAITQALQAALDGILEFSAQFPLFGVWYTMVVRFVLPVLALLILVSAIRSLLSVRHLPETWAYLGLPNGDRVRLTHWENIIGRAPSADVQLAYPSVSRSHAAINRGDRGEWTIYDLDSKGGTLVNGRRVEGSAALDDGDVASFGGVETVFLPVPAEERLAERESRAQQTRPVPPWGSLILLTFFQVLVSVQLVLSKGAEATVNIPLVFLGLTALSWGYCLILRALRRVGFEMEIIAFFLCTLSLGVTASSAPDELAKQFFIMALGVAGFLVLGWFLRDLDRAQKVRWLMAALAIGLFLFVLLLGKSKYGARNWIILGPLSFQPSEMAKICYVFAGAATLDRLFKKRNLTLFMVLTFVSLGCLALMSDFGTAAIFFVTFIVIAFLRSGDWATLALICGGCGAGGMLILSIKPYIARRFAVWGHVWEDASGMGYQQVRTMSAAASGGLIGVGPGGGWLHNVAAADTDLVFGMLCEEWGFVIACLAVLSIITLAVFAVRACRAGRSSFYTIAACAATSMMVFQTCLNVFGAVDILPLTGVTFPFVSNGGSAMLASWGLLAFLKATDTRQNASFAIKLPSKRQLRREAAYERQITQPQDDRRGAPGPRGGRGRRGKGRSHEED